MTPLPRPVRRNNYGQEISPVTDAINRVLALHSEDGNGKCAECSPAPYSIQSVGWPCATVRAIEEVIVA